MDCTFINKTDRDMSKVEQFVDKFYPYAQQRLNIDQPVKIILKSDSENARKILGKTGYYDPENNEIVIYIDDRHPKDILRSISHELVHHSQNCRGEFDDSGPVSQGYAQSDDHMRKMEMEAYLLSNGDDLMIFRDFEDDLKQQDSDILSENKKITKKISEILKNKKIIKPNQEKPQEPAEISDQQWYRQELYKKLAKKWSK